MPLYTLVMWIAVCTDKQCHWERVASTQISAEFDADIHQFYDGGNWSHRVHVVEIPDDSAFRPDSLQNAA
jgi:hypothetical protein